MTERVVLSIVAILMLIFTLQKKDKSTIFLTSGLTLGILVTWTDVPLIVTIGLIIYMFTALTISIYGFKRKGLETFTKASIIVLGIWAFGSILFTLMHWPFADAVKLSALIPLIFYLISLLKGLFKKKEFGFLTIISIGLLIQLLRLWN